MKRRFWMWLGVVFFTCSCGLSLSGCQAIETVGPDGQPVTRYRLTPEAEASLDKAATTAEGIGAILAAYGLTGVGGALVAGAGVWKRLKPQLEEAKEEREIGYEAGRATAQALEEFKEKYPDQWAELKPFLEGHHGQSIENFYRALRGLDPKV